MIKARALRKEIGEMEIPYWVRCWRDGQIWLGRASVSGSNDAFRIGMMTRLNELGYVTTFHDNPGTSGHNIVYILGKK